MSYIDTVICGGPLPFLETRSPIYRSQERTVRERLKASQVYSYVYFRYTPCLTDFTFEFIRRPTPLILSPSYWTFVELTLVSRRNRQSRSTESKTGAPCQRRSLTEVRGQDHTTPRHHLTWICPLGTHGLVYRVRSIIEVD
jgi:hypothetical protein